MDYQNLILNMPHGVERAILLILRQHKGRENAIGRGDLVHMVNMHGFNCHERQARLMIHELRRQGYLICSAPGEDGGYYLAEDRQEFNEFMLREFDSRISDLSETRAAMQKAATKEFGNAFQRSLL